MFELIIFLQQLIASSSHLIAKGLTLQVLPETVLLFRAIISALFYIGWMLLFRRKKIRLVEKKDLLVLLVLGGLNIPLNQFFFLNAIKLTEPPNVSLAYALTPLFVFVIAANFLKEKVNKLKAFGIFAAIAGAVIVIAEKKIELSSDGLRGDLIALAASLSWALFTVIGKNFSRKYGAVYATTLAMITGLFLYVPIYAAMGTETEFTSITSLNWLQILWLGVMTSGVGYVLWYYALTKIEASKLAVFNNLQPVLTTILSLLIFGTPVSLQFIAGGSMIIGGVILTQRG